MAAARVDPDQSIARAACSCLLLTQSGPKRLVCVLTIVCEAVTVMVGRVEFSAATHADEQA